MQSSSRFTKIFKCMVNLTNLKTIFNLSAKIYIKLATKYRGLNQPSISITWSKTLKTDQENNLTSLVQQRELKWDGEGVLSGWNPSSVLGKSGQDTRTDWISAAPWEAMEEGATPREEAPENPHKWAVAQPRRQNWGWMGEGQQGQLMALGPLSVRRTPAWLRGAPGNTERCFREHSRVRGLWATTCALCLWEEVLQRPPQTPNEA